MSISSRTGGVCRKSLFRSPACSDNNASSADVLALIELIKTTVREQHGVELHEEVVYLK